MEEIKKQARDEFDGFLKETFTEFAPHLIDTDENAGERFREKLDSIIDLAVSREREKILEVLTIDVNPSNEDQRVWYRGLGREEAQREMRDKVLNLINTK